MPLLMIEPEPGRPPPEADVTVPGGEARLVDVHRGQMLAIEAPEGGQVAALFAWTMADSSEWLSPHHTRVFGGTFELRMGTRLVTNRRRPIMVVGRDSLGRHDLLLPASGATVDAVLAELQRVQVAVARVPDPVNLFLDARLRPDGRIDVLPSPARPGERWTVRCLIDAHVVVASGPTGIAEASADPPRSLRIRVRNEVTDLPADLGSPGDR